LNHDSDVKLSFVQGRGYRRRRSSPGDPQSTNVSHNIFQPDTPGGSKAASDLRVESQNGLGFAPVDDAYNLTQLRLGIYLQPTKWLKLVGVTQDSRVFFNHDVPNAPPYQNVFDIREAYAQLASSNEGWIDLVAGRQI
jgi:hypothetical protein